MDMQTMFQPPGFRDGGPVQYFQQGGEAVEEPAPLTPLERLRAQTRTSEPRFKSVMDVYREGRMLPIDREQEYTGQSMRDLEEGVNPSPSRSMGDVVRDTARGVGDAVRGSTKGIGDFFDSIAERAKRNREAMVPGLYTRRRPQPEYDPADASTKKKQTEDLQRQAKAQMRQAIDDRDDINREGRATVSEDRTPPPDDTGRRIAERVPATTSLEKLKAEREANKAQRKENQLLALMQAGFAMAAGRSPNALANLAAGGASGVATLAGLEKDRRAEDTALRREILERELAGERTSEARAEREAARQDRALSREQTSLRSLSDSNRSYAQQASNTLLRLEALVKDPLVPQSDKDRYRANIEAIEKDLQRRALEESRLATAISPPGMRQESGDFRAREVGSPRPTSQR
jgi:hypothetical protein